MTYRGIEATPTGPPAAPEEYRQKRFGPDQYRTDQYWRPVGGVPAAPSGAPYSPPSYDGWGIAFPQPYPTSGHPPPAHVPWRATALPWVVAVGALMTAMAALAAILVVLNDSGSGGQRSSVATDERAVRAVVKEYVAAINARDLPGAKALVCPESDGLRDVLDRIGRYPAGPSGEYPQLSADVASIRIDGDRATVTVVITSVGHDQQTSMGNMRRAGRSWCLLD